jgi:hypothetical protein
MDVTSATTHNVILLTTGTCCSLLHRLTHETHKIKRITCKFCFFGDFSLNYREPLCEQKGPSPAGIAEIPMKTLPSHM